ncbi:hypothetical protein [Terrisporobacter sp.]
MPRKTNPNVKPVQTFLKIDALEYLKKLASDDYRSVSKYVEKLLMDHLKENGYSEEISNGKEQKKKITNSITENIEQSANNNINHVNTTVSISSTPDEIAISGANKRRKNTKVAPMNL